MKFCSSLFPTTHIRSLGTSTFLQSRPNLASDRDCEVWSCSDTDDSETEGDKKVPIAVITAQAAGSEEKVEATGSAEEEEFESEVAVIRHKLRMVQEQLARVCVPNGCNR